MTFHNGYAAPMLHYSDKTSIYGTQTADDLTSSSLIRSYVRSRDCSTDELKDRYSIYIHIKITH